MGYPFPIIKSVQPDGSKVWFQHGVEDFTATLNMGRIGHVEKAVMTSYTPPEPEKQSVSTNGVSSDPVQRIDTDAE
jgi:hypothetical protein